MAVIAVIAPKNIPGRLQAIIGQFFFSSNVPYVTQKLQLITVIMGSITDHG